VNLPMLTRRGYDVGVVGRTQRSGALGETQNAGADARDGSRESANGGGRCKGKGKWKWKWRWRWRCSKSAREGRR